MMACENSTWEGEEKHISGSFLRRWRDVCVLNNGFSMLLTDSVLNIYVAGCETGGIEILVKRNTAKCVAWKSEIMQLSSILNPSTVSVLRWDILKFSFIKLSRPWHFLNTGGFKDGVISVECSATGCSDVPVMKLDLFRNLSGQKGLLDLLWPLVCHKLLLYL